jgi:hypothetical protein
MVRDHEVGGSNPLAPTKSLTDLQTTTKDTGCTPKMGRSLAIEFDGAANKAEFLGGATANPPSCPSF